MDRRKYILKRLEKQLCALGYEESFLYRDGEDFIAAIFPMNEETEELYIFLLRWIVDDEDNRILFRAERILQEVNADDESELLRFCNEWNKKWLYGTAVYDKDNSGLHLAHTLTMPDRVSDMFLEFQVYRNLAFAAENFFKEAEKFKWIEKETENNITEGESEK